MVMSRDQKTGQSHEIKTENSFFGSVKRFGYLGITVKNKILFRKKLRAYRTKGMLAITRCRIFCLPVCCPKISEGWNFNSGNYLFTTDTK